MNNTWNRKIKITRLATAALLCMLAPVFAAAQDKTRQILVNPEFKEPVTPDGNPPGWFRAMIPPQTDGLNAGVAKDGGTLHIYLEQKGVKINLFNNWAQRIDNPPAGAAFRMETEVAVENAPKGASVGVYFFDAKDQMLGIAEPKGMTDLTGTKPWTNLEIEGKIPAKCAVAIVRLGLNPGGGKLMVRHARLMLAGDSTPEAAPPSESMEQAEWSAGLELLSNGNFDGDAMNETPSGWFRAMMPHLAEDHKAGMEEMEGREHVVYIEQKGTNASLLNNWAQRVEVIPVGARLKLTVEVRSRDLPENSGVVMIQCWETSSSPDGKLLAAATSQATSPIGGTSDWKKVELEIVVPSGTEAIIVRLGMMQSGKIWFDNASLKIISPPKKAAAANGAAHDGGTPTRPGFQVTDQAMSQLEKINALSRKFLELAAAELGAEIDLRKEIYAQGEGKFEVVLAFSFR